MTSPVELYSAALDGGDLRPISAVNGERLATYTALQRRGIPSRLLYFPDENHWVLKPANSILWHKEVLSWPSRWTSIE